MKVAREKITVPLKLKLKFIFFIISLLTLLFFLIIPIIIWPVSPLSLKQLLPYFSFTISVAVLMVWVFFSFNSHNEAILIAIITLLVLITGVELYRTINQERHIEAVAKQIFIALGSDTKTIDQLYWDLPPADRTVLSEALDYLIRSNKINYTTLNLHDNLGREFPTPSYYRQDNKKPLKF